MIASIADLHLKGATLDKQLAILRQAYAPMWDDHGIRWILCAGDFWDRGDVGDRYVTVLDMIRRVSDVIDEIGIPWIIIAGNHDYTGSGRCGLDYLQSHALVEIVKDPTVLTILAGSRKYKVGCLPWYHASWSVDYRTAVANITRSLCDSGSVTNILLGHVELEGTVPDGGVFTIPQSLIAGVDGHYCLGHIHVNDPPYLGVLWQNNFAEENVVPGWHHISGDSSTFHPVIAQTLRYKTLLNPEDDYDTEDPYLSVRFKGDTLPSKFRNIPFVCTKVKAPARQSRSNIQVGQSLSHMLSEWLDVTGCELPDRTRELCNVELSKYQVDFDLGDLGGLRRVHSLRLCGIGPILESHFDFGQHTVFYGSIGTGKSMILGSVYCALYGRWSRTDRGALVDVCTGDAELVLEAETLAGEKFTLSRTIPLGKSQKVRLTWRDEILTREKDVRNWVESHIGPSWLFLTTSFLDQTVTTDLVCAGSVGRRNAVRALLSLDRYEPLAKSFEEQRDHYAQELTRLKDSRQRLEDAEKTLKLLKGVTKKMEALHFNIIERQAKAEEDARKYQDAHIEYAALCKEIKNLNEQISWCEKSLSDIKDPAYSEYVDVDLTDAHNVVAAHKVLEQTGREISALESAAQKLEQAGCAANPLPCGFIRHATSAAKELVPLRDHAAKLQAVIAASRMTPQAAQTLIKEQKAAQDKRDMAVEFAKSNAKKRQDLQIRLGMLKQSLVAAQDNAEQLESQTSDSYVDIRPALAKELEEILHSKGVNRAGIRNNEAAKKKALEELESFDDYSTKHSVFSTLASAFGKSGIPQLLIDTALPRVQDHLDELCREYYDNQIHVRLSTLSYLKSGVSVEDFSIVFSRPSRGLEYDAASCSGGEAATVRVLLRLAFLRHLRKDASGVLILDEPCAHQNAEFAESTVSMLRATCQNGQLVLATHNDNLAVLFPNVIHLE